MWHDRPTESYFNEGPCTAWVFINDICADCVVHFGGATFQAAVRSETGDHRSSGKAWCNEILVRKARDLLVALTIAEQDLVKDVAELMAAWNKIECSVRERHPELTADEVYTVTKAIMDHALGLDKKT